MSIFNSLGSNYNFGFVLKSILQNGNKNAKNNLISLLEKKYSGKATLLYKGRQALELCLESSNLPKESTVAINGFTCVAVYNAIEEAGFRVELLENDKDDLNFSAKILKDKLKNGSKIKAVIVQNTLGYPCEMEEIYKICKEENLILIEDLAHCVGTKYANGEEAGTVGDFVCLSFSQDKVIDAVSGGALVIRNKKYKLAPLMLNQIPAYRKTLDRLYPISTFKIRKTYSIGIGKLLHFILKFSGFLSNANVGGFYRKYNLPSWYCGLALLGFEDLEKNIFHRRKIAKIYLENINPKLFVKTPAKNIELSVNLRFPILLENRKNLINFLKNHRIYVSDIWYSSVSDDLITAKNTADKILNLPTHINVSEKDALYISSLINQWLN